MAQKLLSITLGTSSAKLAEIVKAGKKIQVFSAYDIPISEGILDDGVILNVEALAEELKQYISHYRIKTKKVVFSIASKRIASKEVVIPYVKEKQIKSLVEMNATDYFPVGNIEDYAINYSIIETVKNAENNQYRMNVIATPGELLEGYLALAQAMKWSVEVIDYAGNAILQVLKTQAHTGEINAILQLGYENTVINIMNGNVQIMQRSVATGLNAVISTVAESVGLDEEDALAFLEDNDISRICSAYSDVKYICDSLISSIGRIFEFYNGRSQEHPITSVMFIGDATSVNGIGNSLSEGLGYEATEIYTLNNVQVKNKSITPEFATNFMANIGSIIDPMNLKYEPKEDKEKAKEKEEKLPIWTIVAAVIASVVIVGSTGAMYFMSNGEVASLRARVNSLSSMRDLETELQNTMAKAGKIADFYDSTKGAGDSIPQLIVDLERIMPDSTSIESISIDNGSVAITAGGLGKKTIAKMITELKSINYISNVNVDFISEDAEKYDSYTITMNISAPIEEAENSESEGGDQ